MGGWILIGVLLLLGPPILAIFALIRANDLKQDVLQLRAQINSLAQKFEQFTISDAPDPTEVSKEQIRTHEPETPLAADPVSEDLPTRPATPIRVPQTATAPDDAVSAGASVEDLSKSVGVLRDSLKTANWLIIAGGGVVALALAFLVKYSIDEGLLGPTARIIIGIGLGLALIALAQYVKTNPLGRMPAVMQQDTLPPAMAGAGVIAIYASILGAHVLYQLMPAMVIFALLACVSAAALLLSLLHGPLLAAMGIAGGYLVPFVVSSQQSSTLALFGYLFFVTCAGLSIIAYRKWNWLSWLTLGGALGWYSLWHLSGNSFGNTPIFAGYLAALGVTSAFILPSSITAEAKRTGGNAFLLPYNAIHVIGYNIFLLLLFVAQGPESVVLLALLATTGAYLLLSFTDQRQILLLPIATLFTLLYLAIWDFPSGQFFTPPTASDIQIGFTPLFPPELATYIVVSTMAALVLGSLGFVRAYREGPHAQRWAMAGTLTVIVILALAYSRISSFNNSISWASVAILIAACFAWATKTIAARGIRPDNEVIIATFAIGAFAAVGLALTMVLERAWLTVALSLLAPAAGWLHLRLKVRLLRQVAYLVALIVLIRLPFNPYTFQYEITEPLILNWMLYGYGIPAIAFLFAAKFFRADGKNKTSYQMEAGAISFFVACVMSQIRIFMHDGDWTVYAYTLSEASLNTILWLTTAYGLYRRAPEAMSPLLTKAAQILFWGAIIHFGLMHFLYLNPILSGKSVGSWFVFDVLLIAYVFPALLISLFLLPWHKEKFDTFFEGRSFNILGGLVLISLFAYLSLEARHLHRGETLNRGSMSDAELYTYSVVWILYALALMGVGIWKQIGVLRLAGLGVIGLAAFKIFVFDMNDLEGLYRVFSFLGLGITLLGIGFLYQRFVVVADGNVYSEAEAETE